MSTSLQHTSHELECPRFWHSDRSCSWSTSCRTKRMECDIRCCRVYEWHWERHRHRIPSRQPQYWNSWEVVSNNISAHILAPYFHVYNAIVQEYDLLSATSVTSHDVATLPLVDIECNVISSSLFLNVSWGLGTFHIDSLTVHCAWFYCWRLACTGTRHIGKQSLFSNGVV